MTTLLSIVFFFFINLYSTTGMEDKGRDYESLKRKPPSYWVNTSKPKKHYVLKVPKISYFTDIIMSCCDAWNLFTTPLDNKSFSRLARVNRYFNDRCMTDWHKRPIDLTIQNHTQNYLTFIPDLMNLIPNPAPFSIKLIVNEGEASMLNILKFFYRVKVLIMPYNNRIYTRRYIWLSKKLNLILPHYAHNHLAMLHHNLQARSISAELTRISSILSNKSSLDPFQTLAGRNVESVFYHHRLRFDPNLGPLLYFWHIQFFMRLTTLTINADLIPHRHLHNLSFLDKLITLDLSLPGGFQGEKPRPFSYFKKLTALTSLNLSGYRSTCVEESTNLAFLTHLKNLNLYQAFAPSQKNTFNLEFLTPLTKLVDLNLSGNNLSNLPTLKTIGNLMSLHSLSLANSSLTKELFQTLPALAALKSINICFNNHIYDLSKFLTVDLIQFEFKLKNVYLLSPHFLMQGPNLVTTQGFFLDESLFQVIRNLAQLETLTIGCYRL